MHTQLHERTNAVSVSGLLAGKRGLIMGVANRDSIAWAIAKAAWLAGAHVAITYQTERLKNRAENLAQALGPDRPMHVLMCDISAEQDIDRVLSTCTEAWGQIDFIVHAIAYADQSALSGKYYDVSREHFLKALDISCYSFTEIARKAAPLLSTEGSLLTLTYDGAQRVIPGFYNTMGVAKAALEASIIYLASDFGERGIRVNAISAGGVKTLAASSICGFKDVFKWSSKYSFLKRGLTSDEVAGTALYLLSDLSLAVTGTIAYVDCGASKALPSIGSKIDE